MSRAVPELAPPLVHPVKEIFCNAGVARSAKFGTPIFEK
jgi:hypothetical protein